MRWRWRRTGTASRSSSSRPSRLATSRRRREREIVVEERAAAEITHVGGVATAPDRTAVFNPAFDVTPPELITAVVTENGAIGEANTAVGQQIADIARSLYARGWMPGTAGNISVRTGQTAAITGSGLSKGELTADDMVTVTVADSQPVSGSRRPSAETAIHTAIYRATDADAVVHVHAPHATAQTVGVSTTLTFSGYELIKGLGTAEHHQHPGLHQSCRRRAHRRGHRAAPDASIRTPRRYCSLPATGSPRGAPISHRPATASNVWKRCASWRR